MSDLISRQAAIDAMMALEAEDDEMYGCSIPESFDGERAVTTLKQLPSAYHFDEWCTECKEYDQERHCCPRFNHVIRTTLQEVQEDRKKGKWFHYDGMYSCDQCHGAFYDISAYCPNCGADMKGEQDDNN